MTSPSTSSAARLRARAATRLARLGRPWLDALSGIGRASLLLVRVLGAAPRVRPSLLIQQVYNAGSLSLVIIGVSGAFVGMVLALQGYNTLVRFGAEESLGTLVAISLLRELGPVLAALLFAGRAGSALTAEIGLMKATEQLDALALMAIDPLRRVLAPRFLAAVIALPLLGLIFNAIGILAAYFVGVQLLGLDGGAFWGQMQDGVSLSEDVANGLIKTAVFGLAAGWIAVFTGFDATPTSAGVGRATTRSVVYTSLAVLGLNFVLTALMFGGI